MVSRSYTSESLVANTGHTIWNSDGFEIIAAGEGLSANTCYTIRYGGVGQTAAI